MWALSVVALPFHLTKEGSTLKKSGFHLGLDTSLSWNAHSWRRFQTAGGTLPWGWGCISLVGLILDHSFGGWMGGQWEVGRKKTAPSWELPWDREDPLEAE